MKKTLRMALRPLLDADLLERLDGVLDLVGSIQEKRNVENVPSETTPATTVRAETPCTIYVVTGLVSGVWMPLKETETAYSLDTRGGTFFSSREAAEAFRIKVFDTRNNDGVPKVDEVDIIRRVARGSRQK